MASYKIPGCSKSLRTTAERRYLIVSSYEGWATVETSADTLDDAKHTIERYDREFPKPTLLFLVDQESPLDPEPYDRKA